MLLTSCVLVLGWLGTVTMHTVRPKTLSVINHYSAQHMISIDTWSHCNSHIFKEKAKNF